MIVIQGSYGCWWFKIINAAMDVGLFNVLYATMAVDRLTSLVLLGVG